MSIYEIENKSLAENGKSAENQSFVEYIRSGKAPEYKSFSGSLDGGVEVSEGLSNAVAENLKKLSNLRKICDVQEISTDSFDVVVEENGGEATWGNYEAKSPALKRFIKLHELVGQPKATIKLVEDPLINVESYMAQKIAESFALAEEKAFLLGSGNNEPYGLLKSKDLEQIEGAITLADMVSLMNSLNPFYRSETAFLMSREAEEQVKSIVDANGRHIWNIRNAGEAQNTIFGIPVYVTNHMEVKKGEPAVLFGNFKKAYQIVDKAGGYMLRDPYTEKPFIKFYTLKKVGGDVLDARAIKALKLA